MSTSCIQFLSLIGISIFQLICQPQPVSHISCNTTTLMQWKHCPLILVLGRVVFRTDNQTTPFSGSPVNRFYDINHFLLVVNGPVYLVVVSWRAEMIQTIFANQIIFKFYHKFYHFPILVHLLKECDLIVSLLKLNCWLTCPQINHDVLVSVEKHNSAGIIQLVHFVEIRNLKMPVIDLNTNYVLY